MENIADHILYNADSRLKDLLDIVVVDNGQDLKDPNIPGIKILPNPNTGGTGGFMRGLLHLKDYQKSPDIVVFMDDDAAVNPEALERIWSYMSCLKDPAHTMLAGAMIREDAPSILHEASAGWTGLRLRNGKTGLDLSKREGLERFYEEKMYRHPYAAWWLCAFAPGDWSELKLPPPLFIKGDDVYFSLGNSRRVLCLNGIAAKHEAFDLKHTPEYNRYFALRNLMITNTRFFGLAAMPLNILCTILRVLAEVAIYNYQSAQLCLHALDDFIKGPEHLCNTDQVQKLQSLRSYREKLTPMRTPGKYRLDENRHVTPFRRFIKGVVRILTISGHILPFKQLRGNAVITLGYTHLSLIPVLCRSYDAVSKDGKYYAHRKIERRRGLACLWKSVFLTLRYAFSSTNRRWRVFFKAWDEGESLRYWSKNHFNSKAGKA